jgi:hypothetical protein
VTPALERIAALALPVTEVNLVTQFESLHNQLEKAGEILSGYFVPPATGNYRFHMACKD